MPITEHEEHDDIFVVTPLNGELDNIMVVTFLAWLLDSAEITTPQLTQAIRHALGVKRLDNVACGDLVGSFVLAEQLLAKLVK